MTTKHDTLSLAITLLMLIVLIVMHILFVRSR